jgi:hypothetical protein
MVESDVNKLPDRIADAEAAVVLRARQLFSHPETNLKRKRV